MFIVKQTCISNARKLCSVNVLSDGMRGQHNILQTYPTGVCWGFKD